MKDFPLSLDDLAPKEASFELSGIDKPIVLCKWSLRVRAWAIAKYGAAQLETIFKEQRVIQMAEMAFFMLKDKEQFKTLDEFLDAISTVKDHINFLTAMLGTVGVGEPEIAKIRAAMKSEAPTDAPKMKPQRKQTGAKSSIL